MDATSLWVATRRHGHRLGYIVTALIVFLAGWQTGRVMSPYYAAHPIVFTESTGNQTDSGGTAQDLIALQSPSATTAPAVAGVSASSEPQPTTANQPKTSGQYVASKNSDLYHHLDCPSWQRIKPENQVWFDSPEQAEAAGFKPSQCTAEKLGL